MRRICLLFACGLAALAGVSEPRTGVVIANDGSVREIYGAAGGFVVGDAVMADARSAASSGQMTLLKLDASVVVLNGGSNEFDAPGGDAVFGFSADGMTGYAYFPADRTFARVTAGSGIEPLAIDASLLGGDVIALAGGLTAYVRRDDGLHAVQLRLSDGAIKNDTALGVDAALAVVLKDGSLVYAAAAGLVVRDPSGNELTVETPAPVTQLALMGEGWVHARAGHQALALRVLRDKVSLFFLPEVAQ